MDRVGYRNLVVWHRARTLAIEVYRQTLDGTWASEWGLRDQMRRAALSVPSNIAEGASRGSNRDSVRFLWFARGSLAELATQTDIAEAIGLLAPDVSTSWQRECHELAGMIRRLIATRSR